MRTGTGRENREAKKRERQEGKLTLRRLNSESMPRRD